MENNQQSFWQFSDQLRLQNANFANLSLNDSIWSINPFGTKRPEERRNFDVRVGAEINGNNIDINNSSVNDLKQKGNSAASVTDFNSFNNDGWKIGSGIGSSFGSPVTTQKTIGLNGGFNKGVYSKPLNYFYNNNNLNVNLKGYHKIGNGKAEDDYGHGGKGGKKNKESKKENSNSKDCNGENNKNSADKRFKTLPPSESLPRNETIGGYIFVCNNDTMEENLRRQLFGLPPRYRDSVRAITPGLPLFLYNYSTHQLHGIYEAASFGGSNIDATAWEDKKNPGESRFPAQVRVQTRKVCDPLDEDAFRPILHHYDGPKFRLELSVPEALSLLDIFAENDAETATSSA
ncbi:hypothetical protein Ancab_015512 [Ancistrocladus abbreviatus]